jgi:hypothetical protein
MGNFSIEIKAESFSSEELIEELLFRIDNNVTAPTYGVTNEMIERILNSIAIKSENDKQIIEVLPKTTPNE